MTTNIKMKIKASNKQNDTQNHFVEVFKTDVLDNHKSNLIKDKIKLLFPFLKVDFDLEDCDKILRIESKSIPIECEKIIQIIKKAGHNISILE